MITGYGDVPTAVRAMKAGAVDFIEKPVESDELIASIERALNQPLDSVDSGRADSTLRRLLGLTATLVMVRSSLVVPCRGRQADGLPSAAAERAKSCCRPVGPDHRLPRHARHGDPTGNLPGVVDIRDVGTNSAERAEVLHETVAVDKSIKCRPVPAIWPELLIAIALQHPPRPLIIPLL